MKLILCILFSLFTCDVFARCASDSLESLFERSEIIVLAKAVNSLELSKLESPKCDSPSNGINSICQIQTAPIVNLVSIEEAIKGNVVAGRRAFIIQEDAFESIPLAKENMYLIFSKKIGDELYLSKKCSGSFNVNGNEKNIEEIKIIAQKKKNK